MPSINKKTKNIFLITVDSLRSDFLDFAPYLKNLAEESLVFKQALTVSPYTGASIAAIFTSQYPSRVIGPKNQLLKDKPTLAEILKDRNYRTAAFHSNPLLSSLFGFNRGFDYFDDSLQPSFKKIFFLGRYISRVLKPSAYLSGEEINKKVFTYLAKAKTQAKPLFCWIHYMDTHGPYCHPSKGYLNKYKAELLWRKALKKSGRMKLSQRTKLISGYNQKISYLDHCLGELFSFLKKQSLEQTSALVITADHGEAFFEHGKYSHPRQLYEELIQVPLLVKVPNLKPAKIKQLVSLSDLAPTILDLAEISPGKTTNLLGKSLFKLIDNNSCRLHEYLICEATPDKDYLVSCLRTEKWKFIFNQKQKTKELYDLEADPDEKINLASQRQEVVKDLQKQLLLAYENKAKLSGPIENPKLNEEILRRIRALGYYD